MWLFYSLIGPVAWAVSTHIDKYLVDRYFRDSDTAILMVFTALMGLLLLPFILLFQPGVFAPSPKAVAVMAGVGVLTMAAMLFYLRAIQSEEASSVAPLFQLSTIFSFALAWWMLGETLSRQAAAGAVLIVAGVLFLSLGQVRRRGFKPRVVFGMTAATFILALANVLFKYYAITDSFWVTTFWTFAGEALFGFVILAVPSKRRQFVRLVRTNTRALLGVSGANELINLGGGLSVRYATMLAPVALVSAVSSTTTLFVFVFGTLLSLFAPQLSQEDLSRGNLMRKAVAAVVVTAGVLLTQLD
jgi:drug/metabolite transporter (DMT)-like permease